jgi:adenine-specific DNA-methyltransferase
MLERLEEAVDQQGWAVRQVALRMDGWTLERPEVLRLVEKLRASGQPLEEVVEGRFYMGVKTGLNDAFVIDEATRQRLVEEDSHSAEIIKPWLRGRDVKRWRVDWDGLYVIFTWHGVDIERYPAIRAYLERFRERLERRATSTSHAWYELQQPQMGIYPEFDKPKIIYPEFAPAPAFGYDDDQYYVANKLYVIPTGDLCLLGVLNSNVVAFLLPHICSLIRGGYIEFRAVYLGQIPIPDAPPAERQAIEQLVRRLLALRGEGEETAALEQELNARVYRLFGLKEEITLIEESLGRTAAR